MEKYFNAMYTIFFEQCVLARHKDISSRESIRKALKYRLDGVCSVAVEDDEVHYERDFNSLIHLCKNMVLTFDRFYMKGWR